MCAAAVDPFTDARPAVMSARAAAGCLSSFCHDAIFEG
jgi:hypothetical protein